MFKYFDNLLLNTELDLSQSVIMRDRPSKFIVRSRITLPRIAISLLFAVPCLFLFFYSLRQMGYFLLLPIIFCPPLAVLTVLFGMTIQEKCFISFPAQGIKSYRLLRMKKEMVADLPEHGIIHTYKELSTGEGKSSYFYYAEIKDLEGFGFCIANDEKRRDRFARDLAAFLRYELCERGEKCDSR